MIRSTLNNYRSLTPFRGYQNRLRRLINGVGGGKYLLTIDNDTVSFNEQLIVNGGRVRDRHDNGLKLTILLTSFSVDHTGLAISSLIRSARRVPSSLLLPEGRPRPLTHPLTFNVARIFSGDRYPIYFYNVMVTNQGRRPTKFMILRFQVIFQSTLYRRLPPPPDEFSVSSTTSTKPPSRTVVQLQRSKIEPGYSTGLFVVFE